MERDLLQLAVLLYALEALRGASAAWRGVPPGAPWAFAAGFALNAAGFAARWLHAGYPPFSNLHEVMLLLTVFAYPVYLLYRRPGSDAFLRAAVGLGAFTYLFYPAFISDGMPRPLMPALQSGWFIPHVSSYMVAYFMLTVAGVLALRELVHATETGLAIAERMARHAFVFLTFGLVSGAAWAQEAWGTYWGWDPKEVWSLVSWLVYLTAFHYRLKPGARRRARAALLVLGLAAVLVTFFIVNFSRIFSGLHSYA